MFLGFNYRKLHLKTTNLSTSLDWKNSFERKHGNMFVFIRIYHCSLSRSGNVDTYFQEKHSPQSIN